jgi:micrococcal nuclease
MKRRGTCVATSRRSPKFRVLLIVITVLGYYAKQYGYLDRLQAFLDTVVPVPATQTVTVGEGEILVERVVDGDTLVLSDGEKIRLIGIDTPETVHPSKPVEPFGPEASSFTKRAVEGKAVQLRFDRNKRDRYQRLLAYVYIGDWCLNEALIRAGYSECITKYPFDKAMKQQFEAAERDAKLNRRGIWSGQTSLASRVLE